MKKFIWFFLIALVIFCGVKYKKVESFFKHQKYYKYMEKIGVVRHCYCPHPDIEAVLNQEGFDYYKEDVKVTSDSLKKLHQNLDSNNASPKIPYITHRIYFTGDDAPNNLSIFYIEEMKNNFNNLNKLNENWQHYIWTNNPELFPQEITSINGVIVKTIEEFKTHNSYKNLLEILENGKKVRPNLTEASDLVRLLAVQKFGGIYMDMDYEIYEPEYILNLMYKHDFIGTRETMRVDSFYANSFFAAKPEHPIINFALDKTYRNYNKISAPEYVKYPCNIYDRILFSGPVLITISYFSKSNINGNSDLILPYWMMMNVDFSRELNNDCKLSEITKEYFNDKREKLDNIIDEFAQNPKIKSWEYTCNQENPKIRNIFYDFSEHKNYKIIGADAMCGTWIIKGNHKKFFYFKLPWEK